MFVFNWIDGRELRKKRGGGPRNPLVWDEWWGASTKTFKKAVLYSSPPSFFFLFLPSLLFLLSFSSFLSLFHFSFLSFAFILLHSTLLNSTNPQPQLLIPTTPIAIPSLPQPYPTHPAPCLILTTYPSLFALTSSLPAIIPLSTLLFFASYPKRNLTAPPALSPFSLTRSPSSSSRPQTPIHRLLRSSSRHSLTLSKTPPTPQ